MPTITELRTSYQSGELTPSDAIRSLADKIQTTDREIQGYISYDTEAALAEAATVDLSLPLGGVPIDITMSSMSKTSLAPAVQNFSTANTPRLTTPE